MLSARLAYLCPLLLNLPLPPLPLLLLSGLPQPRLLKGFSSRGNSVELDKFKIILILIFNIFNHLHHPKHYDLTLGW